MVQDTNASKKYLEMKIAEEFSEKKYGYGVRHIQMACMCITMTALFIARGSMGVAILAMTDVGRKNDSSIEIYEWDKKTQGVVLSSFFWGYMVMQIPAGLLAKRFGGKLILLVSLLANGIVCALVPILAKVGGWQTVCVCRVIMGLTQACLFPGSHTLLGRWLPDHERTMFIGIVYGGSQIGTIIAMPVSGVLAETSAGWKSIFYTISAILFAVAALWYGLSASSPKEHRLMTDDEREYIERSLNATAAKNLVTPWRHIFCTKSLWAIMVTHIGCAMSYVLFFVDMPTYLERGLHISLKSSASLSALPYLGMWLGNVSSAAICEKIFNKGWLSLLACRKIFNSIAGYGMALGLVVLAFIGIDQQSLAIVTLVVVLTMSGFYSAGFMVSHLDLSPNYGGLMLSLTNFMANIGSIGIPIATGFILRNDPTDLSRWRIVFLFTAALTICTSTVFVLFGSADRQPWDDPEFLNKAKADPEEMKVLQTKDEVKPVKQ